MTALGPTPIVAEPIEGGFVVPLPYGTRVDWLRNVQATPGGQAGVGDHPGHPE